MSLAAENEGTRDRVPVGPLGDELGASREEHHGTAMDVATGITQGVPGNSKAVVGEIAEKICSGTNPQTESSTEHLVPGKSCLKRLTADGHGLQAGCVDHGVHFPSESQLEECHMYSCADSETSQDTIDIDDIMNLETEDTYLSKNAPPSLRSLVFQCFGDRAEDVSCHLQNSYTFGICDKAEQRGLTECSGMLEIIGVKGMIEGIQGKLEKDSILDGQRFNEDSNRCDNISGEVAILLQELVGTVTMEENVDRNGRSDKDDDGVKSKEASVESPDNGIEGKASCGESKNIFDVESNDISVESKDICVKIKDIGVESKDNGVESNDIGVENKDNGVESNDTGVESKDNGVEIKDVGAESKDNGVEIKDVGAETKDNCVESNDTGVENKDNSVESNDIGVESKDTDNENKDICIQIKITGVDGDSVADKDSGFKIKDISVDSVNGEFQCNDSAVEGRNNCFESSDTAFESKDNDDIKSKDIDVETESKVTGVEGEDISAENKDRHLENKNNDDNNFLQGMDKSVEQKGTDIDCKDGNVMDETIDGPVSRTLTVSSDDEMNVSSLGSDKVISNPSQSVYRVETTPDVVQSSPSPRLLQGQDDSNEISYSPLSQGSDDVSLFDSESEDSQVEAELNGQAWTEPNGGDINDLASEDRSEHVIQTSSHTEKEHKNNNFDVPSPADSSEKDCENDQGRNVVNCPGSKTSLALGDLTCSHEAVVVQQASTCNNTECHVVSKVNSEISDKAVCYPGFMPASQASSVLGDLILSQEVDTDQVPDLPEISWEKNKAEDVHLRNGPCDGCDGPIKRLHDLNDEPGDDNYTADLPPKKRLKDNPRTEMKSSSSQKRQGDPLVTCPPQKVPKVEADTMVPDQEVPGDDLDAMVEKTLFEDQDKKFYSCDMDILDEKDSPLCQTVDDFVEKPDLHQLKLTNSMKADIMRDVPPAKSVFTWKQSTVHYPTYSESNSHNVNRGDCETALAVVPLRTVRGPLRLGLSKRQTVRPLHSNVKR